MFLIGRIDNNMNINDIYRLHKKQIHGKNADLMLEICWGHCKIVEEIAMEVVDNLEKKGLMVNTELVSAGALIHDLGTYALITDDFKPKGEGITHGEIGYKLALENSVPIEIANFCATHIGVGMTEEEFIAENFPLDLKINHFPLTIEEKIVAFADNYHSKGRGLKFHTTKRIVEIYSEYTKSQIDRLNEWIEKFGDINAELYIEKYKDWQDELNNRVFEIRQG